MNFIKKSSGDVEVKDGFETIGIISTGIFYPSGSKRVLTQCEMEQIGDRMKGGKQISELRYRLRRGFGNAAGRREQVNAYQGICLEAEARIKELEDRETKCKTWAEAERYAMWRGWQELCQVVGVSPNTHTMPKIIEMVKKMKGGK